MLVFTIRVIFRDCSGYWRSRTSGVPRGRPHGRGNHILSTKAKIYISTKHRIRGYRKKYSFTTMTIENPECENEMRQKAIHINNMIVPKKKNELSSKTFTEVKRMRKHK
jgi:hypothetical protein